MQGAFQRVRVRLNGKETTHQMSTGSKLDYTRKVGGQYELENASLIPGRPCADAVQRGPKNLTQRS